MRILLVEDDLRLSRAVRQILEDGGYQVDFAADGEEGVLLAESGVYDAIVLDVMLPKLSGLDVVARLRRSKISTPVLLLTARSEVSSKVAGLDSGADDYMTKPFAPAELMARLRALTRRQGEVVFERLAFGDLTLDLESQDLICGEKSIHLSHKEFQVARILLANSEQTIPKETLINKAWGYESSADDNNVEAYISFLRKKLRFLGSAARIETLRKLGYRLALGEQDADA